jgi:DNA-binding FrmR family transcriptional regulator
MHPSHPDLIARLKRAEGHLRSVIKMIEDERPCIDLAQQLQAVEMTIHGAKRILINDHMEHCIGDAVGAGGLSAEQALKEFKALAKYL